MSSAIEIVVTARDNASRTLQGVKDQLVVLDQFGRVASDLTTKAQGTTRAVTEMGTSFTHSARSVRELAAPLLYELSPALGQTARELSLIVRGAGGLGSGLTALGLVVTATVGLVGGQLAAAWQKSRTELAEFAAVLDSADFSKQTAKLDALTDSVVLLGQSWRETTKAGAFSLGERPGGLEARGQQFGLPPGGTNAAIDQALEKLAKLRAEREKVRDVEVPGGTAVDLTNILGARDRATFTAQQAQRGLFDYRLPSFEATYQQALRDALDLERAGQSEAAARARDVAGRVVGVARGFAFSAGELDLSQVPAISGKEQDVALSQLAIEKGLKLAQGEPDLTAIPRIYGTEQDVEIARQKLDLATKSFDVFKETAKIQLDQVASSRDETRAIEEQVIERQRTLDLAKAGGDEDAKSLANLKAQAALQALRERDEAIPGLLRGISDVEREFGSMGLRMQSLARSVADGMSQSFSDGFFDVITGNFKDLPNVARSFTNSMVRAVSDELAKLVAAPVLGQLRGLFGAGSLGLLALAPGAGSGGGVLPALGATPAEGAAVPSYLLSAGGRPIPAAEINIAYSAGGESAVRALQAGQATVAGGQYVPTSYGIASPEFSQSAYLLNRPATSPSILSQALPIAGSAAALGLSAYGASQGQGTPAEIAISAALGGLSGAALGRSVGSLFDASGIGAGTGALAGAAINTTLALLAKQQADAQALKTRQAAEAANAVGAGAALASSASGATSLADLQRRITPFGLRSTGGTGSVAVPVTVETPAGTRLVGTDLGQDPVASVLDLLRNPGSLKASILAGVDPALKAPQEAATSVALQGMATDLANSFRKTEQGVGVTQEDRLGGLVRRTTVPASRADSLGGGDVQVDQLALDALSSDDRAVLLLDVLSRVAADKDISSTISDPATGQIVSITRIARSTIGLPGGTVPQPPVTPPSSGTTTPPLSTGTLLTAGATIALGLAAQLTDPNSLVRQLLGADFSPTDFSNFVTELLSPSAGAITSPSGQLTVSAPEVLRDVQFSGETVAEGTVGGSSVVGTAGGVLSALTGLYGLAQGAQQGDPLSIVQAVYSLYSGLSTVFPSVFPTLSGAVGSAISAASPGAIAALEAATGAAEAASAVVGAATVVAPIVAGLITWALVKDESKDATSWAVIGKAATMLYEAAKRAVDASNQFFAVLRSGGITDRTLLQQAVTAGGNALYAVYRSISGPGGPIGVGSFFAFTKQDRAPFDASVALLTQNMRDAIGELERQGVTPQQLGQLPITQQVGELIPQQPFSPGLLAGTDYTALAPQYQVQPYQGITGPEGSPATWIWVDQNGVLHEEVSPPPTLPNADQVASSVALGAGTTSRSLAPADVNAQYGGPLWALMRYLAGGPETVLAPVSTPAVGAANPWLPGGAAAPAIVAPTAVEKPLTLAEALQLLQLAVLLYGNGAWGGGVGTGAGEAAASSNAVGMDPGTPGVGDAW